MYTILVPIDNDENRSAAQTAFVAELPLDIEAVRVVLTHVLQGAESEAPEAMQKPDYVSTVRGANKTLRAEGYETEVVEASTPPAEGILELAADVGANLIVIGGRKRSPAGKALFGSVTQSVILNGNLPVVVTGSTVTE